MVIVSTRTFVDDEVHHKLLLRDKGECCLTGATPPGTEAQPFYILSPALQQLWLYNDVKASVLSCLEAFVTSDYAIILRQVLGDKSANRQLQNTMLLSPTVGEAFWKREIWMVPGLTEGFEAAEVHTGCQAQDRQVCTAGLHYE